MRRLMTEARWRRVRISWGTFGLIALTLIAQTASPHPRLQLDAPAPSFAYAASRFTPPLQRFHRVSQNYSQPLSVDSDTSRAPGAIHLEAHPTDQPFVEAFAALEVHVVNPTDYGLGVASLNGAIDLIQEVEIAPEQWRPIEYLPESCCGTPQITLYLEPRSQWRLRLPQYTGTKPARLRFCLSSADGRRYYSEPYLGGYEPGQIQPPEAGPNAEMERLAARAFQ